MEARRARLHAWIKAHHEGSQAAFVHATGINRGELSSLLHAKPFGESRAATLEELADMPKGYLVFPLNESGQTSAAVPPAIQRFAGFGPELQDLLFTLGEAAQALPEIAAHLGTLKQLVHKRLRGGPASPKPKKPKKRKSGS
ncbi:hypothetical protein AXK11_00305 [Cephaloticoccus primus]|uniref:Uncharacterized protein n=2 Tax=Cephaloticoccus primus TaxID=1548207 RepID=A0A139SSZ7_9BACT|nr:hypothetical protein AXK11_00305 [Cephaloticoccus primus]